MLTIRIRADMRFKVCSTLLNHSLPARDALTRVFQGMPVCQVMYKETLTPALRFVALSLDSKRALHPKLAVRAARSLRRLAPCGAAAVAAR